MLLENISGVEIKKQSHSFFIFILAVRYNVENCLYTNVLSYLLRLFELFTWYVISTELKCINKTVTLRFKNLELH